jgi:hypothetical protein
MSFSGLSVSAWHEHTYNLYRCWCATTSISKSSSVSCVSFQVAVDALIVEDLLMLPKPDVLDILLAQQGYLKYQVGL